MSSYFPGGLEDSQDSALWESAINAVRAYRLVWNATFTHQPPPQPMVRLVNPNAVARPFARCRTRTPANRCRPRAMAPMCR